MVDFRIRVIVDTSGAERAGKRVERGLARSTAAADRLRASLGRAFGILGGGLILRNVIRTLAQFDQALATVRAVSGATETQFRALREEAQRLGRETRFTATQAAEGLVLLSRAGFSAAESLETLDDTLLLAQAGALDLATAAGITTATLRGFRLETDQASRVTDVLALAANSANTNVAQLGQAIKFVAPVAAGLSISLEATTAALQSLSDAGLQGTLAGTGLRRVFAELEAPGTRLRAVLQRVGKSARDIAPSQVGLVKALRELEAAGVDTGEALEIFGQRGGPAFEVLSSSIRDIEENTKALEGASGTARRLARIQDDNLLGALLRVRSAFQGVILEFGQAERAGGPLRDIVESLARGLLFLAENIQIVINLLEALAVVVGVKLVKAFVRLTVAIAANPLGFLLTAITASIALLIGFADQIKIAGDGLTTLKDVGVAAFEVLSGSLGGLSNAFTLVGDFAGKAFTAIKDGLLGVLKFAATTSDNIFRFFKGAFSAIGVLFDNLPEKASEVGELIKKAFRDSIESIIDFFISAFQTLGDVLINFFDNVQQVIANTAGSIGALSRGNLEAAKAFADNNVDALNRIKSSLGDIPGLFKKNFRALQGVELLPEVELSKGARDIGKQAGDAFRQGFEESPAQDLLDRILGRAAERARERAAAAAAAAEPGAAPGAPGRRPGAPGGVGDVGVAVTAFDKLLQAQMSEAALLTTLIPLRGRAADAVKLAAEAGLDLTEVELQRLQAQLEVNDSLKVQLVILQELRGPQEQLLQTQRALNELLQKGAISQEQFNQKLREAKIAALEADQSISGGFSRGLLKIEEQINDVGSLAEAVLVNAFNNIEDALVNFVRTGTFEFEQFVNQLLDDIARLLIRLLILQAVQAATGTGAVGAGVGAIAGRQAGGPVDPNRPFLVGEQGPELFRPQGSGSIVPAAETAAMMARAGQASAAPVVVEVAAPPVNVEIINQNDPNEFKDAIDSGELDISIVNVNQRRKSAVRQSLGV